MADSRLRGCEKSESLILAGEAHDLAVLFGS